MLTIKGILQECGACRRLVVKIGDATVIYESDTKVGSVGVNAGLYAVAYQFANGNVVISYRGTDAATGRAIELPRLH